MEIRPLRLVKDKVCIRARRPIRPALNSGLCSMKRLRILLLPLDGMLVHRKVTPPPPPPQHYDRRYPDLFNWVKRGNVELKVRLVDRYQARTNDLQIGRPTPALTTRPPAPKGINSNFLTLHSNPGSHRHR